MAPDQEHRSTGLRLVRRAERAHLIRVGFAALAVAAVAVTLVAVSVDGDSGGAGAQRPPLAWAGSPTVFSPPGLPHDRILRGEVRNRSDEEVAVEAADVRVLDRRGRPVKSSTTFASGYVHGLYPPTRGPASEPESERRRVGELARIAPGETAAVTVSWRTRAGRRAASIDYGDGRLTIPR